jgi:hypothetical protein
VTCTCILLVLVLLWFLRQLSHLFGYCGVLCIVAGCFIGSDAVDVLLSGFLPVFTVVAELALLDYMLDGRLKLRAVHGRVVAGNFLILKLRRYLLLALLRLLGYV